MNILHSTNKADVQACIESFGYDHDMYVSYVEQFSNKKGYVLVPVQDDEYFTQVCTHLAKRKGISYDDYVLECREDEVCPCDEEAYYGYEILVKKDGTIII
tara:strand:- start:293 stop:595 length:303 start_codon:yes stop_codon:yes gene_type:complete